ncbi:MAG: intradiol ring-cleavage dioxygenase [Marmoricola sp.]
MNQLTSSVVASWHGADPRLCQVMESLTRHLHAFLDEVEPTQEEWQRGIDYLTATGHMCDATRHEFILLSDVLGVSMLVEEINHGKPAGATESTVLGPFHMVDSPVRALGDEISLDGVGQPCLVAGRVLDLDANPVPGALVDVWQANGEGFYDVQQPDLQPERNLRGLFTADDDGRYWFRSVVPRYYPIPDDGPVGALLGATGRHPNRPAHVHFIAGAEGFSPVTTQVFVEGSPYLDSDAVFGVKPSLVRAVRTETDADLAASYDMTAPFALLEFDLVLDRE